MADVSVYDNRENYIYDLGNAVNPLSLKGVSFTALDSAIKAEDDVTADIVKTMQDNIEKAGKITDELTKIETDNPWQAAQLEAAKKKNGVSKEGLQNSLRDLDNPVALYDMDRRMVKLAYDPAIKEITRTKSQWDDFYKRIPEIATPELQAMALKEYSDYKADGKGEINKKMPNIAQYKQVDIGGEYVTYLNKIAPMRKVSKNVVDADGNSYVKEVMERDPALVASAKKTFQTNPAVRNNLIAQGLMDTDGNMIKEGENDYFDILNEGLSKGNEDISYFKHAPTAKGGKATSKRATTSMSLPASTTTAPTTSEATIAGKTVKVDSTLTDDALVKAVEAQTGSPLTPEEKKIVIENKKNTAKASKPVAKSVTIDSTLSNDDIIQSVTEQTGRELTPEETKAVVKQAESERSKPAPAQPKTGGVSNNAPSPNKISSLKQKLAKSAGDKLSGKAERDPNAAYSLLGDPKEQERFASERAAQASKAVVRYKSLLTGGYGTAKTPSALSKNPAEQKAAIRSTKNAPATKMSSSLSPKMGSIESPVRSSVPVKSKEEIAKMSQEEMIAYSREQKRQNQEDKWDRGLASDKRRAATLVDEVIQEVTPTIKAVAGANKYINKKLSRTSQIQKYQIDLAKVADDHNINYNESINKLVSDLYDRHGKTKTDEIIRETSSDIISQSLDNKGIAKKLKAFLVADGGSIDGATKKGSRLAEAQVNPINVSEKILSDMQSEQMTRKKAANDKIITMFEQREKEWKQTMSQDVVRDSEKVAKKYKAKIPSIGGNADDLTYRLLSDLAMFKTDKEMDTIFNDLASNLKKSGTRNPNTYLMKLYQNRSRK